MFDSLEMGLLWTFSDAWSLEITLFQALWFVLVPARLWGWYWSPPHRVCSMPSLVVLQQLAIQKGLIHENDTVPGRCWFLVMLDTKQTLKHQRPSSQQMVGSHDLSYEYNVAESPIYSSLTILTLEKSINQMKRATTSPTFSTLMASTPSLGTTNLIGMISCGTTGKIWRGGRMFWNQTPHESKFTIVSWIIQILMPIQGFKQNNHGFFNDRQKGDRRINKRTKTYKMMVCHECPKRGLT